MPPLQPALSFRPGVGTLLLAMLLAVGACSSTRQEEARLSALHFFKRGNQAFADEDYLRAAHLYQEALRLDGRSAVIYYNLGLSYQMLDAYPEAAQAYQHALALDAKLADAHMNLALVYDRLYEAELADAQYNAYLEQVRSATVPLGKAGAQPAPTPVAAGGQAQSASAPERPALRGQSVADLPGGNAALRAQNQAAHAGHSTAASGGESAPAPRGESRPSAPASRSGMTPRPPHRPAGSGQESPAGVSPQWWTQDSMPLIR